MTNNEEASTRPWRRPGSPRRRRLPPPPPSARPVPLPSPPPPSSSTPQVIQPLPLLLRLLGQRVLQRRPRLTRSHRVQKVVNIVHQQGDLLNPALVLARGLHHVGREHGKTCEKILVQPFELLAYVWRVRTGRASERNATRVERMVLDFGGVGISRAPPSVVYSFVLCSTSSTFSVCSLSRGERHGTRRCGPWGGGNGERVGSRRKEDWGSHRVRRPEGGVLPDGRRGRTGGRLLPGGIV